MLCDDRAGRDEGKAGRLRKEDIDVDAGLTRTAVERKPIQHDAIIVQLKKKEQACIKLLRCYEVQQKLLHFLCKISKIIEHDCKHDNRQISVNFPFQI